MILLHLQSSTGVLKEQCDGAKVHVLPTAQLSWFDVRSRGQGRVVEGPHGRIRLLKTLTDILMSFHKEERILYCIRYVQIF